MYYKRSTGTIFAQKLAEPLEWVQWTHHSEGKTHCAECLRLDGCFFTENTHPFCPHHPYCHCTLEPIDYAYVVKNAAAYSDYGKFDPYLFNTSGIYPHNKEKLFKEWGYTAEDALWLQTEMEKQAQEKYVSGKYKLGKLNKFRQRIDIEINIPRKDKEDTVTFISGWMAEPGGKLKLTTPYGGK